MTALKEARVGAGLTQAEAAKAAGVPLGTLRRWEQGVNEPSIDCIIQLADVYGVSCDVLLGSGFGVTEYDSGAMTADEGELLRLYRGLPQAGREFLLDVAGRVGAMLRGM